MTYSNDPILQPWYIPGWGVQHPSYPLNDTNVNALSLPTSLKFVNVAGTFFHTEGGPQPGSMTFTPSASLDWDDPDSEHVIRLSAAAQKVYLKKGQLFITLLAYDNDNVIPITFSYHVKENWLGGQEYDIIVPKDVTQPVEIKTLVVPDINADDSINSLAFYPGDSSSVAFTYSEQSDISDLMGTASFIYGSGQYDIEVSPSPSTHSFILELSTTQTQTYFDNGVNRFIFRVHNDDDSLVQTIASGPVAYLHPYGGE